MGVSGVRIVVKVKIDARYSAGVHRLPPTSFAGFGVFPVEIGFLDEDEKAIKNGKSGRQDSCVSQGNFKEKET